MTRRSVVRRHARAATALAAAVLLAAGPAHAQWRTTDTRDPNQLQDTSFARAHRDWLPNPRLTSPLVDHLPLVPGIPTPRDVLGYHIGAPRTLTYYADQLRYYRALAAATPRVRVETIGHSDEGRELVVVWVSSEANMTRLAENRARMARIADPRGRGEAEMDELLRTTKPHYHLIGGLHSGETGPSEMLMELVYRLATETSSIISLIRENLYVSVTPAADADGRDRNVDWFYRNQELGLVPAPPTPTSPADTAARPADGPGGGGGGGGGGGAGQGPGPGRGIPGVPYWGKYAYHDNNRDINLVLDQMRALADWYFTAHPPIMHDLHESLPLLYTYSGAAPQNPNLDPLVFTELPWFANWELTQMTRYGMPGVYTHAFMDGWSPGYLGSISYNHNGIMKMYETQSGRDLDSARVTQVLARGTAGDTARRPLPATSIGRGGIIPTGRGGAQEREWYRGIPIGPLDTALFTRRANANYMQTGVLSALQLAAMFPVTVLENFYTRTRNSIEAGRTRPPHGYVIPVQRDMTRAATLVNILRVQRIEVGQAERPFTVEGKTYPAGSYLVKLEQPYGRLAKNLLERQHFPDSRLNTYDDSGWTMGLAMNVEVVEVADPAILAVPTTPVATAVVVGRIAGAAVAGNGAAGLAVAHHGSNNMITFRYRLRDVPMEVARETFTADGVEFPAGSFLVRDLTQADRVRAAAEELGLTGAVLDTWPSVALHDADPPRIAIYSQWSGTQNLGWYRLTFDKFGVPYDLIYKERVVKGDLRSDYDVILIAEQNLSRQVVMQASGDRPVPYRQTDTYRFLGMYGETDDMTGGFGQAGVDAFAAFLEGGGTLIATGDAARLPIEFGWAGTVDKTPVPGLFAQRPLVEGEIVRPEHPVFYGFAGTRIPVKYVGGQPFRVGVAHEQHVLARYAGGEASVLSGLMTGADSLRNRPFAVDLPEAYRGRGRVILFSNNPIYRWQNHGEFGMIFNAVLNWNDTVTRRSDGQADRGTRR
jgi:8-oxo-dGTP pyrophosphatase MutT (NUDIX family)